MPLFAFIFKHFFRFNLIFHAERYNLISSFSRLIACFVDGSNEKTFLYGNFAALKKGYSRIKGFAYKICRLGESKKSKYYTRIHAGWKPTWNLFCRINFIRLNFVGVVVLENKCYFNTLCYRWVLGMSVTNYCEPPPTPPSFTPSTRSRL